MHVHVAIPQLLYTHLLNFIFTVYTRPNGTKPFDVNQNGIAYFRITQVCNATTGWCYYSQGSFWWGRGQRLPLHKISTFAMNIASPMYVSDTSHLPTLEQTTEVNTDCYPNRVISSWKPLRCSVHGCTSLSRSIMVCHLSNLSSLWDRYLLGKFMARLSSYML